MALEGGTYGCVPKSADVAVPLPDVQDAADAPAPPPDPGPDEPPPAGALSVQINPGSAVLSGLALVEAVVSSPLPVLGVELHVDQATVATDLIPPYKMTVNTSQYSDGPHTLSVDTANQGGVTATASVEVIFDNTAPVFSELSPKDGETLFFEDGPLMMRAAFADTQTLKKVTLRANGILVGELQAPPFEAVVPAADIFLDLQSLPKNIYFQFRAEDVLGQATEVSHNASVHQRFLWKVETLGEIWGAAAAQPDGHVLFGNLDGKVFSVDPATGQTAWTWQASDDVTFTPAVDATTGTIYAASLDGTLTALSAGGGPMWSKSLGSPPGGAPVVQGDRVTLAVFENTVYSLQKSSGTVAWQVKLPGFVSASAAVAEDGTVYVGCQDKSLYAIQNGTVAWSLPTGGEVWSTPALGPNGAVYVGSNDGYVYAAKAGGAALWKHEVEGQIWGRLLFGSDLGVYVASTAKKVTKLASETGVPLWTEKLGGFTYSSPVQGPDGTIYIATTPGDLYGLDPDTGATRFKYTLGGKAHATPLIVGDRVVVGSIDRNLYGLWRYGVTLP